MMGQKYRLKYSFVLIVCYLILSGFSSCTSASDKDVDVSKVKIDYRSVRFDQKLFACDTAHIEQSINALGNQFPAFASVYFNNITGFSRNADNQTFLSSVHHFLTYKDYIGMMDTVNAKFPNTQKSDAELKDLFKHIKYYFPNERLGDVYYFVSGLNFWSAVTVDSAVGVGLDMYLGKQYPYYASVQIPQYEIDRCEPEYIPVNVSKAIYENMFPFKAEGKTLLELLLQKGRQMMFAEYCLPKAKNELLIGYTSKQLSWCEQNEAMIWNYFAQQKLLYSTQWQDIMRYVNDGPTSTGMPPESPGNIGSWIGWQIMHQYANKHPEKKLVELLQDTSDAQTFLRESGYRPK